MIRFSAGVLLFTAACVAGSSHQPGVAPSPGQLAVTRSGSGLREIVVRGRDGTLRVRPAAGSLLEASVQLSGNCTRAHRLTGEGTSTITLEVTPSTKDKCREAWTVGVPTGVSFRARFDDAEADIADLHTAVSLSLGHGMAHLTRLDGDVRSTVTNGDILASGAASWSRVRLASQVGRVRLSVRGAEVAHTRPPGSGDWVEVPGSGRREVHLETTVGDVTLRLEDREPPR